MDSAYAYPAYARAIDKEGFQGFGDVPLGPTASFASAWTSSLSALRKKLIAQQSALGSVSFGVQTQTASALIADALGALKSAMAHLAYKLQSEWIWGSDDEARMSGFYDTAKTKYQEAVGLLATAGSGAAIVEKNILSTPEPAGPVTPPGAPPPPDVGPIAPWWGLSMPVIGLGLAGLGLLLFVAMRRQ
jgi:hypothetical protein